MIKLFKYSAILGFFILAQALCAQQNKADSLLKLTDASVHDTIKVKALCDLSYLFYQNGEYDKELEYGKKAFKLAQKINWKKGQASGLNRIGSAYDDIGDYSRAMSFYFQALRIAMEAKAESTVAESYQNIGIIYLRKGSYDDALKNYRASLKIKTAIADKKGMAISYNNIGLVYYYQGNYPEAIKNFLSSLTIGEAIGDVRGMGDSYNNIGSAYENLGNFDEALKNNQKALEIKKKLADKQGMASCYNNIANIYFDRDQFGMALPNYEMTIKLSEESGDKKGLALGYSNLANVYDQLGNPGQAYAYQSDALFMRREIGDKQGIAVSELALGELDLSRNRLESAEKRFKEGLRIAEEIGSWDNLRNGYQSMYRLESKRNNKKAAYINYRLYITYKDSLFSEQRTKETVQNQMQYEFDKKETADSIKIAEERTINALKFEQEKKQRYYLYIGLGLVVVFAGFMFNRFKVTQKQKKIIEIKEREAQHQKEVVEEKQKEILDSIRYAKRIQKSLLPTEKYIQRKLTELRGKVPLFLIAVFVYSSSFAQIKQIDSLLKLVQPNVQDTSQVNVLNRLSGKYESEKNFPKSRHYAYKALLMAEGLNFKRGVAEAHFNIGYLKDIVKENDYLDRIAHLEKANKLYVELGDKKGSSACFLRMGHFYEDYDYKLALKSYNQALKVFAEIEDKDGVALAYGSIGSVYEHQGNYPDALKYYFKSLKLHEEQKNVKRIAATYNNIAIIKMDQQDFKGSEEMLLNAISQKRSINDTLNVHFSNMLENLGIIYFYLGNNKASLDKLIASMKIREDLNDVQLMAASYGNIGSVYRTIGNFEEAMKISQKGLNLQLEVGDKKGASMTMVTIGQLYLDKENYPETKKWYDKGLVLAKEIGHTSTIKSIYECKAIVDSVSGDFENAMFNYQQFISYRDSMYNEDNTRRSVEAQMHYEFDKKQTADSLKVAEERKINTIKFEQEKKQRYYLYVGLALVVVFAGFMFNRFKVTQKQKKIIEIKERETQHQKEVVEEKQKEILDSIRYAKRIQKSLMPTEKYIDKKIRELKG